MNAEHLAALEQWLYCRVPLLGRWLRGQAVQALARDGSPGAVGVLAEAVTHSADEQMRTLALDALQQLAGRQNFAAQEALCRLVVEHDHPLAYEAAVAAGYAPRAPEQRALFYFLTEQWDRYESLDFDSQMLRSAYESGDRQLRTRLARKARQAGRLEWVQVVAGGRQGRRLGVMTDAEWQAALAVLVEGRRGEELWRLAHEAPPRWSAQVLQRLRGMRWQPPPAERARNEELMRLAEGWETPPLGGLLRGRGVLEGHRAAVRCLALSPDKRLLASGSEDQTVRLWTLPGCKRLATLTGHEAPVLCLALTPDGKVLASASADGTVRLWSPPNGDLLATLTGHRGAVTCLALSPDGRVLASGSTDCSVRLWSLPEGRALRTLQGHEEPVNCLAMTPDGRVLASGGGRWHQDWAVEDGDYTVRLWTLPAGRALRSLKGHLNWVSCLAMSPDGKVLASAGSEVRVWRIPNGQPWTLKRLSLRAADAARIYLESYQTGSWANCLAISPDGAVLASGNMDRTVRVWRLRDGWAVTTLEGHARAVHCLVLSPDGHVLISGSGDQTVRVWSFPDGRPLTTLAGHSEAVTCLALSHDGQVLVSGSADHSVRVWTSELIRLSHVPVRQTTVEDWLWVLEVLRGDGMTALERRGLEFIAALLRWQRRHDVMVEAAAPRRIEAGEFDIEIDEPV